VPTRGFNDERARYPRRVLIAIEGVDVDGPYKPEHYRY
jgi:hypothetical protein